MQSTPPASIDERLAQLAPPERKALERVRKIIRQAHPDATEVISYGMPGFKLRGKYLVTFEAFRDHLSLFPGSEPVEALADKLTDYKTSKGTVQFTVEQPLPEAVIKELLAIRAAAIPE